MNNQQPISKLANYFLTELCAVLYLVGISLDDAMAMFRDHYIAYAVGRTGTQGKAAKFLGCHRNRVNKYFKSLGAGANYAAANHALLCLRTAPLPIRR